MGLKRKDFQKAAAFLKEFLLKLSEDIECAELRDTLTLALLHMQKYYRLLQCRTQERTSQHQLTLSARGLSPMTPFVDAPDKFQWKWISLDSAKYVNSLNQQDEGFYHLPDVILATREGNTEWIIKIIQQDPTLLDERDSLGRTGLFYAIHYNHMNILKCLLYNGSDPNVVAHDGTSPVHKACHDGNPVALELLIEHGGDIHAQDTQLRSPIHWAVTTPGLECLEKLIENRADVSSRDKDGLTPCMWACRMDHKNHFEMLYKSDKNLSNSGEYETDDSGRTWLHWAVRRTEPLKCLQLLLSKESAALKDEDGKTVILVAAELGSFPACKLIFEQAGPHVVYDCDNINRTALHLATIRGHGTVLNFLLENGADLEMRDQFQATAWDYAKNKQLHYCQLIMMSHRRQSLQSSPRDSRSNGDVVGGDGNLEPWMKSQENTPHYTPGGNRFNRSLTDRSNNGDISSRVVYNRNSVDNNVAMNKNNNNSNNENYHIKNDNNNIENIPSPKNRRVKIIQQRVQVHGAGNLVYSKISDKENEAHPVKDLISSPCPPKRPRTGKCLGRSSFHHRSLSESFDQHFSTTQSADYAEMDPVEMSRSEGTESRMGVYERSNTLDNHHISHEQELENCAHPHMNPDSNEEIEVVSDEMEVSNIDEDDQPSSSRVEGNFSHENQNTDPQFPYQPQNSPAAPLLGEITPHPELPNEERQEVNNSFMGAAFPYPRPPQPPPVTSSQKGSHPSVILLNRRPLLSRNPPKSQPQPKQHLKPSSAKPSGLRQTPNPQMVNNYRPETAHKGKVPKQPSLGSDTSEEQYENPNSLSWQGLTSVPMNSPAGPPPVPVNPILPHQEPLPKFLHRGSMPPPGPNSLIGTNLSTNAWPSDRPGNSELASGNLKLTEMSDVGMPASELRSGLKSRTESQDGAASQQHLSPSSSTSSLSLAHNKAGGASMFHMATQPTGPGLGGQKNDIRRLPSALIPLTNAQSLPHGQPIAKKKKKKRKKQANQELLFENTVIEGKSLQNSVLSSIPVSVKPLAPPTGLSPLTEESKTEHFKQRMEPTPPMLNSQKKPSEMKSVDSPFMTGHSNPNKGRECVGGLQMVHSTLLPADPQNSRFQREFADGGGQREESLNELTTVGTGLFAKKSPLDSKPTANNMLPSKSEENHQDFLSGKPIPVPIAKEKWSLPDNGLLVSSKKQSNPPSPFSLVEPELVKTKPPLPHTRKSLLR